LKPKISEKGKDCFFDVKKQLVFQKLNYSTIFRVAISLKLFRLVYL